MISHIGSGDLDYLFRSVIAKSVKIRRASDFKIGSLLCGVLSVSIFLIVVLCVLIC